MELLQVTDSIAIEYNDDQVWMNEFYFSFIKQNLEFLDFDLAHMWFHGKS